MKRTMALLLLLGLLAGCGSAAGYTESAFSGGTSLRNASPSNDFPAMDFAPEVPAEAYYDSGWYDGEIYAEAEEAAYFAPQALGAQIPETLNLKMIYTASISLESTEFDAAVERLAELVSANAGWFESSRQDNYGTYRNARYTIRIPAENFSSFCDHVGELCKVRSLDRSADDISEAYYDTESRLATQKIKLERLQALLEEARKMEDIITLESAISDTEYVIENLTGSLRKYDSLVGYSTITVSLSEVYQIVETEEPVIGFDARLVSAFRVGTSNFIRGLQEFALDFARAWASWLLFIVIVLLLFLLVRRIIRRRRKQRGEGQKALSQKKRGGEPSPASEPHPEEIEEKTITLC